MAKKPIGRYRLVLDSQRWKRRTRDTVPDADNATRMDVARARPVARSG